MNQVQVQTFASSTFSSFLDILLSCFVFLALTLACFLPSLVSPTTADPPAAAALALAPLAGLLELASLVLSIRWGDDVQMICVFLWVCFCVRTCFISNSARSVCLFRPMKTYLYKICCVSLFDHFCKDLYVFPRFNFFPGGIEKPVKCHISCWCQCCAIRA